MANLKIEHLHAILHLVELNSLNSEVSKDAVDLTVQLQAHQIDHSDIIRVLAEGPRATSHGRVVAVVALARYCASVEEQWKAREKELVDRLTSKVASFF